MDIGEGTPKSEILIPEKEDSIDSVLIRHSEALKGKAKIDPLEAWIFREIVRTKYGLPECGYRWKDPLRYIDEIKKYLRKNKTEIRYKHDFARFFEENPKAQAVFSGQSVFRESTVVVQVASESDWYALRAQADQLSHEVVHVAQNKRYSNMPDELAEREAYYYQIYTPNKILKYKDDPDALNEIIINRQIENSIKSSLVINRRK